MQDILISKITIPSLSAESIRRETLYRKLKKISAYTLSVFTAGAGYGKTTALIQYLSGFVKLSV
jgi:ATP/maltotriose-dependent transcriptional regulator MalT